MHITSLIFNVSLNFDSYKVRKKCNCFDPVFITLQVLKDMQQSYSFTKAQEKLSYKYIPNMMRHPNFFFFKVSATYLKHLIIYVKE